MESPGADEPKILQALPLDLIRRAVEIYLGIAYPNSEPPPAVRRRLDWPPGLDASELLSSRRSNAWGSPRSRSRSSRSGWEMPATPT